MNETTEEKKRLLTRMQGKFSEVLDEKELAEEYEDILTDECCNLLSKSYHPWNREKMLSDIFLDGFGSFFGAAQQEVRDKDGRIVFQSISRPLGVKGFVGPDKFNPFLERERERITERLKQTVRNLLAVSMGNDSLDMKLRAVTAYSEGWDYAAELAHTAGLTAGTDLDPSSARNQRAASDPALKRIEDEEAEDWDMAKKQVERALQEGKYRITQSGQPNFLKERQ